MKMTNEIIEVDISTIKIGSRFRKDMGDLEEFARSIEDGLLQPIGITPEYELVFGERRLRAYRDVLGRKTIPARFINVKSLLLGEITENNMRKDYTPSERVAIVETLGGFKHGGDRRSDQIRSSNLDNLTINQVAKRVGFSKDGYFRAKTVTEKGIPELVKAMDSGRISVHAASVLAEAEPEEQTECMIKRLDDGKATARVITKTLRQIRNRKEREAAIDRAVSMSDRGDSIQIYHCSFQNLEQMVGIESESVHLICTDIPYGNEFLDQIEQLAAFAERVLVVGGTFVAYLGQHRFNEKLSALDKHLKFQWVSTSVWNGAGNEVPHLKLINKSIPLAVYSKDRWSPPNKWSDTYITNVREKDWHEWQRPLSEVEKLVCYFSKPSDLVVDPCGGGFTTAIACLRNHRRFVGCDIDHAAVSKGQERLELERRGSIIPVSQSEPIPINSIVQGDCRDLIPRLADESINLCVDSPPYTEQRSDYYPSVSERDYPAITVDWMEKLRPKLADTGSVLIVIDPHVKGGEVADYVLRTQLALRAAGWKQHRPLIWLKRDGPPLGRNDWPRHAYEQILWFSKSKDPYCDPTATGRFTEHLSMQPYKYGHSPNGGKPGKKGIARITDVFDVPIGQGERGIDHPAKFPVTLAEELIAVFCPPNGTVLDPFAGSGSTLVAAAKLSRPFFGFEIVADYVELARRRLKELTSDLDANKNDRALPAILSPDVPIWFTDEFRNRAS